MIRSRFAIVSGRVLLAGAARAGSTLEAVKAQGCLRCGVGTGLPGLSATDGKGMGPANDWAFQAVRQVGNDGELFERNPGSATPLGIERGLNTLWRDGGLHYAPPVR